MLLEQFVRTGVAFFIGIYLARYLGPKQFGLLSYGLSLVLIVQVFARLGMDSILTREISRSPESADDLKATAVWLMLAGSVIAVIALWTGLRLVGESSDIVEIVVILLVSVPLQCLYVVDYHCQSQQKAKLSSLLKVSVLLAGGGARVVLVCYGAPLSWFVVLVPVEALVMALAFGFLNQRLSGASPFARPSFETARKLVGDAWPMVLSSLSVILYLRIDQVMIQHMLGHQALGFYSAASKIYEGWVVLPVVLSVAALPRLVKARATDVALYERELCMLFSIVFWGGGSVAIICFFFSDTIIRLSFGQAFLPSAEVLSVSMWAAAFAGLGSVSVRYFVVEGLTRLNLHRTVVALLLNVALNFFMIPRYGIQGAAYSTLICLSFSNFFMDILDPRLRRLAILKSKALIMYPLWHSKEAG
ncbi:flippase [Pseudomonas sp. PKS]